MNKLLQSLTLAISLFVIAGPSSAIEIKQVTSAKGIKAWLVEDHTNPIITVDIAFRGGSALDPAGKEGLANLVSATLDEGAGAIKSQAFQQKLEDLAISLSFSSRLDSFSGSLRTLKKNQTIAFNLLRLALTEPRFDAEPIARIRGQIIANIRRQSENPRRIARRTLFKKLFQDHPYGRPSNGTEDSVNVIKIADLKIFVEQRLARNNLVVSVIGDITEADLKAQLDKTFGALPAKAMPWELAEITPDATKKTIVVDKAIPQSIITFAQPGIKRDHPDFFPAYVMNYVLGGGGFESRLYEEVREKRGLAYSAYSYLAPLDHAGIIIGGAGTANARTGETVTVLRDEWAKMHKKGLNSRELKDAKTYLTGSYPLRFSSSGRIAGMMTAIQMEKLGLGYIKKRNSLIEAVTLKDVNRVAAEMLDPEKLTMVVVGKPKGVTSTP
ncbi:MAG: insulinase family protein [Rhodospirillaceae bacterium]|jgi:zinc protease|nr:insulinase family protein [Rhodospirillaceae bacterium]MBT7269017.1 insulinase family protein [Rhodospirillaceae bacterium]